MIAVDSYAAIAPPDGLDANSCRAESVTCGDSIATEQLLQCSIRSYILAGCKLRNQINTSDNDSIATLDLTFLN